MERTAKDVINKIQHLEKSFRLAWEYARKVTGAGVKENDPASFEQKIESTCFYYYDLLPIMGDRSSNNPKGSSDNLDDDEEEEIIDLQEPRDAEESEESVMKNQQESQLLSALPLSADNHCHHPTQQGGKEAVEVSREGVLFFCWMKRPKPLLGSLPRHVKKPQLLKWSREKWILPIEALIVAWQNSIVSRRSVPNTHTGQKKRSSSSFQLRSVRCPR